MIRKCLEAVRCDFQWVVLMGEGDIDDSVHFLFRASLPDENTTSPVTTDLMKMIANLFLSEFGNTQRNLPGMDSPRLCSGKVISSKSIKIAMGVLRCLIDLSAMTCFSLSISFGGRSR